MLRCDETSAAVGMSRRPPQLAFAGSRRALFSQGAGELVAQLPILLGELPDTLADGLQLASQGGVGGPLSGR